LEIIVQQPEKAERHSEGPVGLASGDMKAVGKCGNVRGVAQACTLLDLSVVVGQDRRPKEEMMTASQVSGEGSDIENWIYAKKREPDVVDAGRTNVLVGTEGADATLRWRQ
jgi:hypothetical protein